ncbi:hypothetical protein BX600DRAFT_435070 [Xylariales sp. PMI_506]|nr:hypothetical protein BX600DRAFT_435070 [Xylariales sp. PMI_506]
MSGSAVALFDKESFDGKGKGIDLQHIENAKGYTKPKLTRRQKTRKHCKRFWICYLLAAGILAVILIPLFFTKILPAIAQDIVNNTNLPIYGATVSAVSNDQVVIGMSTALSLPAGITVNIEPFTLYLYNEETLSATGEIIPYTQVNLPYEKIHGTTPLDIENETVSVGNRTELNSWLTRTLNNETTSVSVSGHATSYLGAIKIPLTLQKTVTINGLNKLKGVSLDTAQLVLPPRADGTNLIGSFTFQNPSILTMGLGNLTFNALAGDVVIGNLTILNAVLPPGASTSNFTGQLFLDSVIANLGTVLESQSGVFTTGNLTVGVSGNSTLVNGEHITYLENVINKVVILTEVPIVDLAQDLLASITGSNPTVTLEGLVQELELAVTYGIQNLPELLSGLTSLIGFNISSLLDDIPSFLGNVNITGVLDQLPDLIADINITTLANEIPTIVEDIATLNFGGLLKEIPILIGSVNITGLLGDLPELIENLTGFNLSSLLDSWGQDFNISTVLKRMENDGHADVARMIRESAVPPDQ